MTNADNEPFARLRRAIMTTTTGSRHANMEQTIKVNGPYVVGKPLDAQKIKFQDNIYLYRQLWPVIQDNTDGPDYVAAITYCVDKYNAQWVANALNMLKAIDDAAILRRAEPQDQDQD